MMIKTVPGLILQLYPDESEKAENTTGTASIPTSLSSDLVVSLSADNAKVSMPTSVTILAGHISATFQALCIANGTVTLTASATGYNSASQVLTIIESSPPDREGGTDAFDGWCLSEYDIKSIDVTGKTEISFHMQNATFVGGIIFFEKHIDGNVARPIVAEKVESGEKMNRLDITTATSDHHRFNIKIPPMCGKIVVQYYRTAGKTAIAYWTR